MLQALNDTGLHATIGQGNLVVVAFLKRGQPGSEHFRPEIEAFALQVGARMSTYWVDVDENPTVTDKDHHKIRNTPTTLIFNKGSEIDRYEGPYSVEALIGRIERLEAKLRNE